MFAGDGLLPGGHRRREVRAGRIEEVDPAARGTALPVFRHGRPDRERIRGVRRETRGPDRQPRPGSALASGHRRRGEPMLWRVRSTLPDRPGSLASWRRVRRGGRQHPGPADLPGDRPGHRRAGARGGGLGGGGDRGAGGGCRGAGGESRPVHGGGALDQPRATSTRRGRSWPAGPFPEVVALLLRRGGRPGSGDPASSRRDGDDGGRRAGAARVRAVHGHRARARGRIAELISTSWPSPEAAVAPTPGRRVGRGEPGVRHRGAMGSRRWSTAPPSAWPWSATRRRPGVHHVTLGWTRPAAAWDRLPAAGGGRRPPARWAPTSRADHPRGQPGGAADGAAGGLRGRIRMAGGQ